MQLNVANDLSDSAFDFERVVAPAILPLLGGGELVSTESVTAEGFQKDLDTLAGIDGWHLIKGKSLVRGLASRVQWCDKAWKTFTVRLSRDSGAETEFSKRLRAIENPDTGYLYPHLTIQAYIESPRRGGQLLGAGIVKTKDLITLCDRLIREGDQNSPLWGIRRTSNAEFIWVSWRLFQRLGLQFAEFGHPEKEPS
jgi:hypothetical protein